MNCASRFQRKDWSDMRVDLRKGVTWSRKSFLSYVHNNIVLNKGSIINFKVVKTDILRPSYGHLNYTKCICKHT